MKKLLLLAAAALTAFAAQAQKIQIFDHTQVHAFGSYEEFKPDSAGVLHAGTGRYIFKKVNFPTYKRTTRATINITLASNGDRWDKSGSCFVIPACDDPLKMIQGKAPLAPGADSAFLGVTPQGGKATPPQTGLHPLLGETGCLEPGHLATDLDPSGRSMGRHLDRQLDHRRLRRIA